MRYIGWAFMLCVLAGIADLIDFRLCIDWPGQCSIKEQK